MHILVGATKERKWLSPDMISGLKIYQKCFCVGALPRTMHHAEGRGEGAHSAVGPSSWFGATLRQGWEREWRGEEDRLEGGKGKVRRKGGRREGAGVVLLRGVDAPAGNGVSKPLTAYSHPSHMYRMDRDSGGWLDH